MLPFLVGPTEFYRTAAGLSAQEPRANTTEPARRTFAMMRMTGIGPAPDPVGPLGGVRYYPQSNKSYAQAGYEIADDYSDRFHVAGSIGKLGIVPQPTRNSRRAFLPRVGVVFMSQNRQPFPTNRIQYAGAAPNAIFPTVTKPYPWAVPPYNAARLYPSAPGGAVGGGATRRK
jgi:hypothetical protein